MQLCHSLLAERRIYESDFNYLKTHWKNFTYSGMADPYFYRSMCQRSRESLLRGIGTCRSASWSNACVYLYLVPHPVYELYPFGRC